MANRRQKEIKNKWVVQWAGLIALGVLIWWGGPMINVGGKVPLELPANRLLLLLLVIIIWLTYQLLAQTRSNQTDLSLMAELSAVEQDPAQMIIADAKNEEANELRYKFQSALRLLKESQAREKLNQRYLYELPWYIVIGAPGSGKTTLLRNSGISFPVKEELGQETVQGIGGTRNCNWLFSDEAIFIDTAGRYTTHDSHKAIDAAAWNQFLKLLKKYRPQRPVNGVLFTLSLSDMLTWSEEELGQYARTLRRRAMELNDQLGITIPIYLFLTKCDLVAGFTEFFEDLDLEKRSQVWGVTFPADPRSPLKTAPAYLNKLFGRLEQRRINRVQQERDLIRRGLIIDFPEQMKLLQPLMMRFLEASFRSTRFERRALLRGVYFTSGTQQGTPIDRITRRLAKVFGLSDQKLADFSGHVKSFFISRVLREVILPESTIAGVDGSAIRRRKLRNWALSGALFGLMTILIVLWSTSYGRNTTALTQVETLLDHYEILQAESEQQGSDAKHLLYRLNTIATAQQVFKQRSWWEGIGLYQGKKIKWSIQRIYQKLLIHDLLELIRDQIEYDLAKKIKSDKGTDPSYLYEVLKIYLMLGMPEKMDPQVVHNWARMNTIHLFPSNSELQEQLQVHLDRLFHLPFDALALDRNLITQARDALSAYPLYQLLYANLKSRILRDDSHDLYLKKVIGAAGLSIMTTRNGTSPAELRIPAWYTLEGYQAVFENNGQSLVQEALSKTWVTGRPPSNENQNTEYLYKKLQEAYFDDYERHWRSLLESLKVKSAVNTDQIIHITDSLSGPESPLKPLLLILNKNTNIIKYIDHFGERSKPSGGTAWYGPANAQAANTNSTLPLSALNLARHFADINQLVQPALNQSPPIDAVLSQLATLRNAMLGSHPGEVDEILQQSKEKFSRLPEPIAGWLLPLTEVGVN